MHGTAYSGTGADVSNTTDPFPLPGTAGDPITEYPEGYNATIWGPSGNMTVDGQSTFSAVLAEEQEEQEVESGMTKRTFVDRDREAEGKRTFVGELYAKGKEGRKKRGVGFANETDIDINTPPYAIHNGASQSRWTCDPCLDFFMMDERRLWPTGHAYVGHQRHACTRVCRTGRA